MMLNYIYILKYLSKKMLNVADFKGAWKKMEFSPSEAIFSRSKTAKNLKFVFFVSF